MASLSLKHISKQFGDVVALSDVSLHVENGQFCVLLGPSGCGKSTLLHIVAGLESQDRGSVSLAGEVVDDLAPRERDVAMVFQSYALYPHMTVSQNLGFALRMRGMTKTETQQRVRETARLLEIEDLLKRKPRQLSGGQRQRVAMGRALVRRPRLFLLDEPLSNLDAQLRIQVRLELKKLHKNMNTTILYVTHDQVEAMTLGDKVVVMRHGRVHQIGTPGTIYDEPEDTFVATFVGSPVMNFFKGRIGREGKQVIFRSSDFSLELGSFTQGLEGKTVEVGVRPEDITVAGHEKTALQAHVEMLSNVGADQYIHAKLGKSPVTVRAPKHTTYDAGDVISLSVAPEMLHVFEEGKRITLPVAYSQ
jgi:ABC-type sugar transport system ATPase subunit